MRALRTLYGWAKMGVGESENFALKATCVDDEGAT